MVKVVNLKKAFGQRVLFQDINLSLDVGKRYGLIGANGAGKSTFMKILSGEIEPTSGNVSIQNGLKVGVLSQNQYAYEDFTLKDAVMIGNKRLYEAIKEMAEVLLKEEVITGKEVQEIIEKNGGIVFKDEDLHQDT